MDNLVIKKEAIRDLLKIKEKFDLVIESIELMTDKKFMSSYKEARVQIKKRKFVDWNEL